VAFRTRGRDSGYSPLSCDSRDLLALEPDLLFRCGLQHVQAGDGSAFREGLGVFPSRTLAAAHREAAGPAATRSSRMGNWVWTDVDRSVVATFVSRFVKWREVHPELLFDDASVTLSSPETSEPPRDV
jgi:hypothetical protein